MGWGVGRSESIKVNTDVNSQGLRNVTVTGRPASRKTCAASTAVIFSTFTDGCCAPSTKVTICMHPQNRRVEMRKQRHKLASAVAMMDLPCQVEHSDTDLQSASSAQ